MKVWGIGLARTGTKTLLKALKILGIGTNPAGDFHDLRNADYGQDFPVYPWYKYIDYIHPGSKFILTTRNVDDWLDSIKYLVDSFEGKTFYDGRKADYEILGNLLVYGRLMFDRNAYRRAFYRHHLEVLEWFLNAEHQLLIMDFPSGDGWEKLCEFLQCPVPDEPFPHMNRRSK